MAKTRKRRNVHRRKTKKHHRRRNTKRRVKRRRKTTRKKRGRGIGPSSLAKGATAALAASAVMGQGSAAISPQGRDVQRQLNAASCSKIQNEGRRMVAVLHPDRGGKPEDFSEGWKKLEQRRNACGQGRQRGDTGRNKPQRRPGESAKKARQRARRAKKAEASNKAKQQEEQAKAKARTQRQQEADARAGRRQQQQEENTESTGPSMSNIGGVVAATAAAGLAAREMVRGRQRQRNWIIQTTPEGRRFQVRQDGSIIRELTPERR